MKFFLLTSITLLARGLHASVLPTEVVGNVQGTAFENLATRYNGQILATTAFPNADVYLFDPAGDIAQPVHVGSLPGVSGSYGISELGNQLDRDIFYVLGGNYSITTFTAVPQSYKLYEVNMRGFQALKNGIVKQPAKISLVTNLTATSQPNGMTQYGGNVLLLADSVQGAVWAIDLTNRSQISTTKIIQDASMAPNLTASAFQQFGINGLRASGQQLFYCNSGFHTMNVVDLNNTHGSHVPHAAGVPRTLAQNCFCDDFDVDQALDMLLVASPGDYVVGVDIKTGNQTILAGAPGNLTAGIPGGSSAQVGDCGRSLYVSTNANGNPDAGPGLQGIRKVDLTPLLAENILQGQAE